MKKFFIFCITIVPVLAFSQKNVTTFGIQLKPLISNKFFDSGQQLIPGESFNLIVQPRLGFNFGMLMRKGYTDNLSLEAGINMVRRNYQLEATDLTHDLRSKMKYSFVGYEIPVQGLLYVRLGKQLFMNAAGGLSFDFYPSSAYSVVSNKKDTINYDLEQLSRRNTWGQISVITNLGFEYRTKEKGYFYLGASLHRSFKDIAQTSATYTYNRVSEKLVFDLNGNYLTFDLRYFFYEEPERKVRVK